MGIREQKFTCKRGEMKIVGMEFYPAEFDERKKYPVVIASHGFRGNYLEMMGYCQRFAEEGYLAYCFSFCGGGVTLQEESTKSDGATTDMTIFTEVEDLLAVKEYVKKHLYVDEKNVILLGASQGGFVSGLTAARCGEEISKLIMIYPALCIPDDARKGCLGGAEYDVQNVPEQIDCGNTVLGKAAHDTMVGLDPYLELAAYHGPVLILHGTEDTVVNYSYAIKAKESYRPGQCSLQLIRNAGHGFAEHQYESVLASIRQFLDDRKEILSIRVVITHVDEKTNGEDKKTDIYFVGYCETPYFQGATASEGCDARESHAGVETKVCAEYTLVGHDSEDKECYVHIINKKGEKDWKPIVETNSAALAWLNDADLTAILEYAGGGPTVRIFADKSAIGNR